MRSSVLRENDHPFRFAKHPFGSGFFLARCSAWPHSGQWKRVKPAARSPQHRKAQTVAGGHECPWEHSSGQRRAARCDGVSGSLNIGISPAIQPESHGRGTVFILMLHDATDP
jgi:hypothetical protein